MSGRIAFKVVAVSIRVSPFLTEDPFTDIFNTDAPRRFAAISKETRVLVEFSKNIFKTVVFDKISGNDCFGLLAK